MDAGSSQPHASVLPVRLRPHSPATRAVSRIAPDLSLDVLVLVADEVARLPERQHALYVFCLVARLWYAAAVEFLYSAPVLAGRNYLLFIRTLCPSINLHVRHSEVAPLVKALDLSRLVHEGSRTITSRLLGRVKHNLETLVAPQTSFAVNSLPALSKCHQLTRLDLSLISEALPITDLVHAVNSLRRLKTFHFPRCQALFTAGYTHHFPPCPRDVGCVGCSSSAAIFPSWSSSLEAVYMPCDIKSNFLTMFAGMPPTMTSLIIEDGSRYNIFPMDDILWHIGPQILRLQLRFVLPKSGFSHAETRRPRFPSMRHLDCLGDHLMMGFFHYHLDTDDAIPLQSLTIHSSGGPVANLTCGIVFDKVADGNLKNLRKLRLDKDLGWALSKEGRKEAEELSEYLQVLKREDVEATDPALDEQAVWREVEASRAGVWFFAAT
ncbi:hypothetical protein MMC13_003219 [Lambiella insularis]|nr:hypothetical protein [Lambiella insularis]